MQWDNILAATPQENVELQHSQGGRQIFGTGKGCGAMRFRGEYQHSVDSKGRVSLPAKFRKALPDEVTIVPVANADFGKALYVFSDEAYDEWMDSFFDTEEGGYNPRSKRHIALHKYLNSSAESVAVDARGRVKLSPKQCEKVGIDKNVTIIGEGDHIEIWDSRPRVLHGFHRPVRRLPGRLGTAR